MTYTRGMILVLVLIVAGVVAYKNRVTLLAKMLGQSSRRRRAQARSVGLKRSPPVESVDVLARLHRLERRRRLARARPPAWANGSRWRFSTKYDATPETTNAITSTPAPAPSSEDRSQMPATTAKDATNSPAAGRCRRRTPSPEISGDARPPAAYPGGVLKVLVLLALLAAGDLPGRGSSSAAQPRWTLTVPAAPARPRAPTTTRTSCAISTASATDTGDPGVESAKRLRTRLERGADAVGSGGVRVLAAVPEK